MTHQYKSIRETFKQSADMFPNKTALIYLGEKYSYAKLDEFSDQMAGALYNKGVRTGDRVIIYAPHCPQWIIAWLAVQKLGCIAVPITHFYGPKDLLYIANDSGAETIFCMDTNFGYVNKILADTKVKRVIVNGVADLLPGWKRLMGKILDKIPNGKFTLADNIFTFNNLLKEKAAPPSANELTGEEIAEILYTGGTTGYPKGVPISNALFLESSAEQRKTSLGVIPLGEDVVIQGSPLYHILGQVVGFGCLFSGETLILLPKNSLDAIFDHIARYRAKTMLGTPTMYRMILEHDRIDQYNLSSLKYSFSGGDVLPKEIGNRWLNKIGSPIYQGYGITETCGPVANSPAGQIIPEGAAGKVVSSKQVLVVNSDTMEPMPVNEPGELLVSSQYMVPGYWNKPEETALHFIQLQGRLWYKTGDIVRVNQDGWLYFMDRSVDVIKHKGYRVAASKIDNVLQEHMAVIASCTIGVPDPAVGERIKSYVIVKDDVKGVSAQELIKWCRERLASYEVPQYIEFRDMLPKSKVGKILRRELRAEEKRKAEAS